MKTALCLFVINATSSSFNATRCEGHTAFTAQSLYISLVEKVINIFSLSFFSSLQFPIVLLIFWGYLVLTEMDVFKSRGVYFAATESWVLSLEKKVQSSFNSTWFSQTTQIYVHLFYLTCKSSNDEGNNEWVNDCYATTTHWEGEQVC